MLHHFAKTDFDKLYPILEASFPVDEIRPYDLQKALFDDPAYGVLGLWDGQEVRGLITVYDLGATLFVEHFAVNPEFRNQGLGARILQMLLQEAQKPVCLEVELPDTELAKRRIGFYRRNGFYLNHYPYTQPPLAPGQNPVSLQLMTSSQALTPDEFAAVRDLLYQKVYHAGV